jgi:hypothetical protein
MRMGLGGLLDIISFWKFGGFLYQILGDYFGYGASNILIHNYRSRTGT